MTSTKIEWGIFLINGQPEGMSAGDCLDSSIEYAVTAEQMGFETAWVLEHHFSEYGLVPSPIAYAAFLLGKTKHLKVGTAIQILPLDHPVRMAEQVALIDQLSGGRLMFGVGRGAFTKDFVVFGKDQAHSREMADEYLAIMIEAWRNGKVGAQGRFVRFLEVPINPPVFTRPHPPLYTVALSSQSIEWAARNAIPLIHAFGYSDVQTAAVLRRYNLAAEKAGHNPAAIPHVLSVLAGVSNDAAMIKAALRKHLTFWEETGFRADAFGDQMSLDWLGVPAREVSLVGERSSTERVDRYLTHGPIGSAQECVDRLAKTIEITGIRRFAVAFEGAGERSLVLDSMHRFSTEVIPQLQ